MQCSSVIEQYVQHLQGSFWCQPIDGGLLLVTPYLRPDNDAIAIYVSGPTSDGAYVLSDRGETLEYLNSLGPDFLRSRNRAFAFRRVVREHELDVFEDEIRASSELNDLPAALEQMLQALKELTDLGHLIQPTTRGTFQEQVAGFLIERRLPVRQGYSLEGAHKPWKVDFYLNSQFDTAIEAMSAGSSAYAVERIQASFMKLYDLHAARAELNAIALLDDQEGRSLIWPQDELAILSEHATIMYWQERDRLAGLLIPGHEPGRRRRSRDLFDTGSEDRPPPSDS